MAHAVHPAVSIGSSAADLPSQPAAAASLTSNKGSVGINSNSNKFNMIQPPPVYMNNVRKQSTSSSSSSSTASSDSSCDEGSPASLHHQSSSRRNSTEFVFLEEIADNPNSLVVKFKCSLSDEKEVEWKTLLVNGVLYVDIPSSVLPKGSRDSFVSLLEFAEEKLDCHKVYVCFKRNRPDRTSLMRVFMFFGFSVVPPGNQEVPQSEDIMSMVYNIQ